MFGVFKVILVEKLYLRKSRDTKEKGNKAQEKENSKTHRQLDLDGNSGEFVK